MQFALRCGSRVLPRQSRHLRSLSMSASGRQTKRTRADAAVDTAVSADVATAADVAARSAVGLAALERGDYKPIAQVGRAEEGSIAPGMTY
jgi:hypothetical protein